MRAKIVMHVEKTLPLCFQIKIDMIHTVYIDDEDSDGRVLLKEIRRINRGVRFAPLKTDCVSPEGYMTVEEFRTEAKKSLTKILNEHGIC